MLMVFASVVMVYSASAPFALQKYKDPYYFLVRQGLWAVLGVAVLALTMRIDYRSYKNDALIWTGLGAVAVLLVGTLLFGHTVNGARRWMSIAGMSFQPSEF